MVNAWGMGTSLPETDNDKKRRFGTEVRFIGTDEGRYTLYKF